MRHARGLIRGCRRRRRRGGLARAGLRGAYSLVVDVQRHHISEDLGRNLIFAQVFRAPFGLADPGGARADLEVLAGGKLSVNEHLGGISRNGDGKGGGRTQPC